MIRRCLRDHPARLARPIDKQLTDDAGASAGIRASRCSAAPGRGSSSSSSPGAHDAPLRRQLGRARGPGGPIFYGHAASGFTKSRTTGNVFWPQAQAANQVFKMLDGKQQKLALVEKARRKSALSSAARPARIPESRSPNSRPIRRERWGSAPEAHRAYRPTDARRCSPA